ncbi:MAG: 30S ribosomal protein S6 [Patescibacteria group bacterium]
MTKDKTATSDIEVAAVAGNLYLLSALVQKDESLETIKKYLEGKAEVVKAENLGRKTLAYKINKHSELTLVSIFFTAQPEIIPGLEKELALEEQAERFLITTWRGEVTNEGSTVKRPRRVERATV